MDIKITPTGSEPITLDDVKLYCKIDYTAEDALITSLIGSVRGQIEKFLGRSLIASTIELYTDYLPDEIRLPYPEHDAITEVKINGTVSTDYTEKGLTKLIVIPSTTYTFSEDVVESFYVKYTTTGKCSEAVKTEMLRLIDEKYRNRGNTFVGSTTELSENTYANLRQFCEM